MRNDEQHATQRVLDALVNFIQSLYDSSY